MNYLAKTCHVSDDTPWTLADTLYVSGYLTMAIVVWVGAARYLGTLTEQERDYDAPLPRLGAERPMKTVPKFDNIDSFLMASLIGLLWPVAVVGYLVWRIIHRAPKGN